MIIIKIPETLNKIAKKMLEAVKEPFFPIISGTTELFVENIVAGSEAAVGSEVAAGSEVVVGSEVLVGSEVAVGSEVLVGSEVAAGSEGGAAGSEVAVGSEVLVGSEAAVGSEVLVGSEVAVGSEAVAASEVVAGSEAAVGSEVGAAGSASGEAILVFSSDDVFKMLLELRGFSISVSPLWEKIKITNKERNRECNFIIFIFNKMPNSKYEDYLKTKPMS